MGVSEPGRGHTGREVPHQDREGGPVQRRGSAGKAAVARVETVRQPEKSGVSSYGYLWTVEKYWDLFQHPA